MLNIQTIDTPTWHAILITDNGRVLQCIGFHTPTKRDWWLARYTDALLALAAGLPI